MRPRPESVGETNTRSRSRKRLCPRTWRRGARGRRRRCPCWRRGLATSPPPGAPAAGPLFRNSKDRRFTPRPPGTAIALPGRGITDGPLWLRCRPLGQHSARPSPRSGVTGGICGPLAHGVDLGATRREVRPCIGNRPRGVTDDGRPPPSGAVRLRRVLRRPSSGGRPGGELGWDSWGGQTATPTPLAGRRWPAAGPTNPPSRRA